MTTTTIEETAESALRRQRLAHALQGLVRDLADERRRTARLRRENAELKQQLVALEARAQ